MSDGRDDQLADLAHAFEAGFRQLDSHGRFPAETASALIARVRAHPNSALLSPTYLSEIFLGSFTGLPREAQAGIQEAIGRYDRLRLAGQEFGPAYLFLLRSLWRIRLRTRELATRGGSLAKAGATAADVMCYGTRKLPDYARTKVRAASLKVAGRIGRGRSLGTVLACAGLDESDLVVDYARDVPQPPGYRLFWHDPERNSTVAKLTGIDLVRGTDGCWLVEVNVSPSLLLERSQLYQHDPLVEGMIETARAGGYRRLVYFDNSSDGVDPLLAARLTAAAVAAGLELDIVNRPNVPQNTYRRAYRLPDADRDTLVIDTRVYWTSLDRLLMFKSFSYKVLENYKAAHHEPDLRIPTWSTHPFMSAERKGEPFPDLVYKLPGVDQGQGLALLKCRDLEHAATLARGVGSAIGSSSAKDRVSKLASGSQGLWQAFVRPEFAEGRRLYKIRALVLISPGGARMLSAHRAISSYDVPHELRFGIVADPRPYVVNHGTGARYAVVPAEEIPVVRRAAEAIGRGLASALERAFVTSPPGLEAADSRPSGRT